MAHESFEDEKIANILNEHFISIKVDKEERPDIDSIYMAVCQALTGNGGWPTSIFMTQEQKPFFAGTYFPKETRHRSIGLKDLLLLIHNKWKTSKKELLHSADSIIASIQKDNNSQDVTDSTLIDFAVRLFKHSYDNEWGGFGSAPKFPSPHKLLFLMRYYQKSGDKNSLEMAEHTLLQMYKGGMFDHIGFGFSRYSTDRYFLVPHFEKMLYDNALLILAYCKAFSITKNPLYCKIAEQTATYILREMTTEQGAFYSAQDADSDGEEGKYYVFEPSEISALLGEKAGHEVNDYFSITNRGNFEGKSIPNLLGNQHFLEEYDTYRESIYKYRKQRCMLHLDDKVLTSWNSLMIAAMCWLYRITQNKTYLNSAKRAQQFLEEQLCQDGILFVSYRNGTRNQNGFLDDYANYIFALLALYEASLDVSYLKKASKFAKIVISDLFDATNGGFYLSGEKNEMLIVRPKECFDGAIPSGNSVMAYNLVRLFQLSSEGVFGRTLKQQIDFLYLEAKQYPTGYAMYLMALSDYFDPPEMITVVLCKEEDRKEIPFRISVDSIIKVLEAPTEEYKILNNKTTYYICHNHSCLPPVNELIV